MAGGVKDCTNVWDSLILGKQVADSAVEERSPSRWGPWRLASTKLGDPLVLGSEGLQPCVEL